MQNDTSLTSYKHSSCYRPNTNLTVFIVNNS